MKYALAVASLASTVAAFGAHNQPPKGEVTKTDNFVWADPFHDHRLAHKLSAACTVERSFQAREFLLHDLYEHDPKGLWNYGDALKTIFTGRPYPGGWDGLDPHMYERPLLQMNYTDVPIAVREWIEEGERGEIDPDMTEAEKKEVEARKNLFAVFERHTGAEDKVKKTVVPAKTAAKAAMLRPLDAKRVVIFAPGALYNILPLWVADTPAPAAKANEDGEAGEAPAPLTEGCRKQLLNLEHYSPKPKDGGVIAWTTQHTAPNRAKSERAMTFTIKAQTLKAAGAASVGIGKDEL